METGSFCDHLNTAMDSMGVKPRQLESLLKLNGVTNITWRRIGEYKRQENTPDFQKARAIFDALDYNLTDEEIRNSLLINQEEIRNQKETIALYTNKKIVVRICYSKVKTKRRAYRSGEAPSIENRTELIIRDRLEQLYGQSEGMMTTYVHDLIGKDLDSYILKREDR